MEQSGSSDSTRIVGFCLFNEITRRNTLNYYKCSDGTKVSQSVINSRRSAAYRDLYEGEPHPSCAGCNKPAEGTAHLVPQKVVKSLGKSEYCWLPINMVPACHRCNSLLES